MPCSWWARWQHRRLRVLDMEIMWRSLYARAETLAEARVAWEVFLRQEGQEHWQCPCGEPIAQLFRTLTITLKE